MLDTQVNLSTAFHRQTDSHVERTIQTLESMLRACVIDLKGNLNSYHSSISMALFESLYSGRCRSLLGWFEVCESSLLGHEIIYDSLKKGLSDNR